MNVRLCLLLLCWLACVPISWAQPVFDAATSSDQGVVLDATFSHTASGSDRLAILCVGYSDPVQAVIITKTYGGIDMPLVGSVGSPPTLLMYALVAPPLGLQPVFVEWDAFVNTAVLGVATFTGVHQTTPLGLFDGAFAETAGPATVSVTSAANELVVDCEFSVQLSTITVGAGQTVRWERDTGTINPGGSSTEPGAAPTVTMSWTISESVPWYIGGLSVKPAAVVGVSDVFSRRRR